MKAPSYPLSSRAKPRDLQFYGPFLEMFFMDRRDLPSSSNLNENLIPFDTYSEHWNSFFTFYGRPGRRIEGPRVPRTNDVAAFDHPFGQRAAPVWTFIIQRPNHPTDVSNAQRPAAGTELLRLAGTRQLPLTADPN
jgi:hypothetical protein